MGGHRFQRLTVLEIVAEFSAFLFLARHYRAAELAIFPEIIAKFGNQIGIFAETLHQYVFGAIEHRFDIGKTAFRIEVGLSLRGGVQRGIRQ